MTSRRLGVTVLALGLAGQVALGTSASGAEPRAAHPAARNLGIGIRLLDASASRRNDPRAMLYVDDFVHPGDTFTRHVSVSDQTPHPVHLLVYANAASVPQAGFVIADGHVGNELTSWMSLGRSSVDLKPGQAATVPVTFRVPSDASKGERYAAILAELPAPKPDAKHRVTVATRVGVRVYLDVGAGGEPASSFTVSTLTAERAANGVPVVTAQVQNTGGRALDLTGSLTLSDGPGGSRAGPFDVPQSRTLGIGATGDVAVPLDRNTPAGPWLATMRLQSGTVKHVVKATITFPTASGTAAPPVKAKDVPLTRNRHLLVPIAIGLLALLALLLLLLWWRRRRDDDEENAPPAAPERALSGAGRS